MIEANEFPELSEQYEVMGVPRVIINDTSYFEGALPEPQFLQAALETLKSSSSEDRESIQLPKGSI